MPSKAYLKMLNEIPDDIQKDVIESLGIANEIYLVLENKGLRPTDLAKLLGKSESEISKWLTGTHNFTQKTIRKIEEVLNAKLLVPNSYKIAEYETKLERERKLVNRLRKEIVRLHKELDKIEFNESYTLTYSSSEMRRNSQHNRYMADFIIHGGSDDVKIKAQTASTLSYRVFNC